MDSKPSGPLASTHLPRCINMIGFVSVLGVRIQLPKCGDFFYTKRDCNASDSYLSKRRRLQSIQNKRYPFPIDHYLIHHRKWISLQTVAVVPKEQNSPLVLCYLTENLYLILRSNWKKSTVDPAPNDAFREKVTHYAVHKENESINLIRSSQAKVTARICNIITKIIFQSASPWWYIG